MATEINPLIIPFDPLWVTTSKREYREAVRRMGSSNIVRAVRTGCKAGGHYWKRADEEDK